MNFNLKIHVAAYFSFYSNLLYIHLKKINCFMFFQLLSCFLRSVWMQTDVNLSKVSSIKTLIFFHILSTQSTHWDKVTVNWHKIMHIKDVMHKMHTLQNQFIKNLQFCFISRYCFHLSVQTSSLCQIWFLSALS